MIEAPPPGVQATLAAAEITLDDLDDRRPPDDHVEALDERLERLEHQVAAERGHARALRARQDLVLQDARAPSAARARSATSPARPTSSTPATSCSPRTSPTPCAVPAARFGPRSSRSSPTWPRAPSTAWWWISAVAAASGSRCFEQRRGRPRRRHQRAAVQPARRRGLDVRHRGRRRPPVNAAPTRWRPSPPSTSWNASTTPALVDLLDRALVALRPGGLLILSTSNPTALDVGAADFWLDPARRRPVHPRAARAAGAGPRFRRGRTALDATGRPRHMRLEDFAGSRASGPSAGRTAQPGSGRSPRLRRAGPQALTVAPTVRPSSADRDPQARFRCRRRVRGGRGSRRGCAPTVTTSPASPSTSTPRPTGPSAWPYLPRCGSARRSTSATWLASTRSSASTRGASKWSSPPNHRRSPPRTPATCRSSSTTIGSSTTWRICTSAPGSAPTRACTVAPPHASARLDQPLLDEVRWFLAGSEAVRARLARFNAIDRVGLFHAGPAGGGAGGRRTSAADRGGVSPGPERCCVSAVTSSRNAPSCSFTR